MVDAGGALVLACSTVEEGRDPAGLVDISRRSGVRVVMGASSGGVRRGAHGGDLAVFLCRDLRRRACLYVYMLIQKYIGASGEKVAGQTFSAVGVLTSLLCPNRGLL